MARAYVLPSSSCSLRRHVRSPTGVPRTSYEDITSLAIPVLRHRILLNFHAESDRIDTDEILRQLIAQLPPPRG